MRNFSQQYKNVFLVDDDPDDRDLFAEAVAFVDPTVNLVTKRDGEDMMDYVQTSHPPIDLIFLDLNMPRKNGKECLVELRANMEYKDIPIVIYTTSLNPIDIDETFTYGATWFLRKPNSFEELKEALNSILQSSLQATPARDKTKFVIKGKLRLA